MNNPIINEIAAILNELPEAVLSDLKVQTAALKESYGMPDETRTVLAYDQPVAIARLDEAKLEVVALQFTSIEMPMFDSLEAEKIAGEAELAALDIASAIRSKIARANAASQRVEVRSI